jgi:hypothetical protein
VYDGRLAWKKLVLFEKHLLEHIKEEVRVKSAISSTSETKGLPDIAVFRISEYYT